MIKIHVKSQKERKRMGVKKVLEETLAENFSDLARDINLLIKEAKQDKPKDIHTKTLYN